MSATLNRIVIFKENTSDGAIYRWAWLLNAYESITLSGPGCSDYGSCADSAQAFIAGLQDPKFTLNIARFITSDTRNYWFYLSCNEIVASSKEYPGVGGMETTIEGFKDAAADVEFVG